MKKVEDYVRTIPDFPEPGIMFRDVTSVLQDPDGLKLAIDEMAKLCGDPDEIDAIIGLESRGFIFGMPLAYNLHKPFIPSAKRESFPARLSRRPMIWSTGPQPSRCTRIPSNRARRSWWWTI